MIRSFCGFCGSNTVPPDNNTEVVLQSGALPSELLVEFG
jgi:hypothetical protein